MPQRLRPVGVILTAIVLLSLPAAHAIEQASPVPAAQDLVPVNVYVVDRSGKPVADLKQEDFTVLEDGVPQQVRSFAPLAFDAGTPTPGAAPALRKGIAAAPQNGRMFAILLGRGRLDNPSGYVTGLLRFVKTQLLPQDQVAIVAYDRALPFTTDHQKVAATLERFKKSHEDVDFALGQQLGDTGMAPLYGTRDLMALLEYLRRFDGHKHVLFVTENGLRWPSDAGDQALATIANDARASIYALETGGNSMGVQVQELPLTLSEAEYASAIKDGLPYAISFPAIRGAQNIRFVVYDFGSDLVGRVDTTLR